MLGDFEIQVIKKHGEIEILNDAVLSKVPGEKRIGIKRASQPGNGVHEHLVFIVVPAIASVSEDYETMLLSVMNTNA